MRDKPLLLISFSGGRTSAFMTKWCLENYKDKYEMIVVFANTGKERNETLDFVEKCDEYFGFNCVWVEAITNPEHGKGVRAKIVDYTTASRNGEPFEAMIAKHGIPTVRNPHCTRELKKYTIQAYARSIRWKHWFTAIGIRSDEVDRMSPDFKKQRFVYPLISDVPTRKNDINKFWSEQPFDLELKTYEGNCDLCFKKSFRKLMTIVKENPDTILWWSGIEWKYRDFIPESRRHNELIKPPLHCFRQNKSIWDIVKMAQQPFEMAIDESAYKPEYKQKTLFDELELDRSNGCIESCEVF
jgi:hypothetical protein